MPDHVYCEDCEFAIVRADGRDLPAWRWLCMRAPRHEAPNFVTRGGSLGEPWSRCAAVNADGGCILFQPRRGTRGKP